MNLEQKPRSWASIIALAIILVAVVGAGAYYAGVSSSKSNSSSPESVSAYHVFFLWNSSKYNGFSLSIYGYYSNNVSSNSAGRITTNTTVILTPIETVKIGRMTSLDLNATGAYSSQNYTSGEALRLTVINQTIFYPKNVPSQCGTLHYIDAYGNAACYSNTMICQINRYGEVMACESSITITQYTGKIMVKLPSPDGTFHVCLVGTCITQLNQSSFGL